MGKTKNKGCKIRGCKLKHSSKGFCRKHYTAFWKGQISEDGIFLDGYVPKVVYRHCRYPQCKDLKIKGHGLCQMHYKRAQAGRIDLKTCAVIDEEWHKIKNHIIETINGIRVAVLRESCKIPKCKNKDLHGRGLCKYHYSRLANGFITENGDRLAKPLVRYRDDFQCAIPNCNKTHRESRMTKGLCRYHYQRYDRGLIDYQGHQLRKDKKVASYKGIKCKHYNCTRQARVVGFCSMHYEHFKKGFVDEKGRKLKEPTRQYNVGKKCKVKECNEPAHAKLYCKKHYNQVKYWGAVGNWLKNKGHSCSEIGCEKPAEALGLCSMHYYRFKKYGQTEIPRDKYKNKNRRCAKEGCNSEAHSKGYCHKHYARLTRTGKLDNTRVFNKDLKCPAPNCDKPVTKSGMCGTHYYRMEKHGSFDLPEKKPTINANRFCKVDGCDNAARAKGYCGKHYKRLTTTGSLFTNRPRNTNKVCKENDCNEPTRKNGYCGKHFYQFIEKPRSLRKKEINENENIIN